MDRSRARRRCTTGAPHRAHRRQRRVDGGGRTARASRLLLDGRARRRHAGRRSRRRSTRSPETMYDADARLALPRRAGHPRPGALPERRRLRERLLPASRRSRAGRAVRARVQRLPHDWCSADPDRLLAVTALPFWDVDLAIAELAPRHRARSPGGELLQPAPGLRPAAARAPALGSDVGRGPGGRHLGELPRRRRLDGHAVRRRRRAWAG